MPELENIIRQFYDRTISGSKALELIFPLIRHSISDEEVGWLVQELEGYAIAVDDEVLEKLPLRARTYRLVYTESLILMHSSGIQEPSAHWPPNENRLQLIHWKLAEIENKLTESTSDQILAPCIFNLPDPPKRVELKLAIHKSQLNRICERFRYEFFKLLRESNPLNTSE